MALTFDDAIVSILDGKNFATVATIDADGSPHTSVVWFLREGDTVCFSTTTGRRKARNLARDPRVSLTVFDLSNPYHAVDIRGIAELVPDDDRSLPQRLSQRYLGEDPPAEPAEVQRLIVRVVPEKVTSFSV